MTVSKKRVVITGYGAVTPIGNTAEDFWSGLMAGESGVEPITNFDVSEFSTKIAAQVKDLDLSGSFDKKEIRRYSKFVMYAVVAAKEALALSGLDIAKNPESIGVEIGSGIGGLEVLEETVRTLVNSGPARVSPFTVPMMIADMATGLVAIKTGAKGPNSASVTACASGSHSIGNAFKLIQRGDADAMISGGSEACVIPSGLASFCAARSLSSNNENPKTASRPFEKDRDGFVMGEGAGIMILESLEHAQERGATIYAEVVGFGSTGDAYHITAPAPEGEGANRAMKMALKDAGIQPSEIDYINAHGTSTSLNDKNETKAIKDVFGDAAKDINISSTKSMTGHLLGAAGAIELVACTMAIQNGKVPPTTNYDTPDPECDLNYTPNQAVDREIKYAMSNSFGFGGHNAVLIIKAPE